MDTDWRRWLYQTWNERLIEYCFRGEDESDGRPVERIPATPEELREVVRDPTAEPEEVVAAFVVSVKRRIPSGVSFEGFCTNYMAWSPASEQPPRFFAMLWLTCLVAYGYPDGCGGFHERMTKLFGRSLNMDCLPDLWHDVEQWTRVRASHEPGFRPLKLPPDDRYRSDIGHSWFLAFPHQHDRRRLRELLERHDLVGDEPPVVPVVSILKCHRNMFSSSFQKDLDVFVGSFFGAGADVRDSPFWRAVRQEALPPAESGPATRGVSANTALMAALEDDELYVYVACSEGARLPAGFFASDFGSEIDGFSSCVIAGNAGNNEEGLERAVVAAFEGRLDVPKVRSYARRGVLVFQEVMTHEYRLVGGSEANQAEVALVRNDRVQAFLRAYGGTHRPSRIPGWQQVIGCRVSVRPDAPRGLEGVKHLQETMVPPVVRLVGGIRTGEGFYAFPGFLPIVRFDRATRVEVVDARDALVGEASRSSANCNEWRLPEELAQQAPGEWTIRVFWTDHAGHDRKSETRLVFVDRPASHRYKRLGIGRYYVEASEPGEAEVVGGQEIPLGITGEEVADDDVSVYPDPIVAGGGEHWSGVEPDHRVGLFTDALAALSVRKSGIQQTLFFDLFSEVLGLEIHENPVLFYDLLRGWTETGAIDIALAQGRKASYITARRPGFVAFRSGNLIRASLIGLVPSYLEDRVRQVARIRGARCGNLLPPCEWLPKVLCIESDTPSVLRKMSEDLELAPPRWLRWPLRSADGEELSICPAEQGLRDGAPPTSFTTKAQWDWWQGRFSPGCRSKMGIRVHLRTHPERASVYVIVVDAEDWYWSYIRNWILLLAQFMNEHFRDADEPAYRALRDGPIIRTRKEDVYLPLPVGRLCAILGDGLAGPVLSSDSLEVEDYRYPLGLGYRRVLAEWISGTGCVEFGDRESD